MTGEKIMLRDVMRPVYDFVPMQDFSEPWTDEKLYAKYGITKSEQKFIESLIKPIEEVLPFRGSNFTKRKR